MLARTSAIRSLSARATRAGVVTQTNNFSTGPEIKKVGVCGVGLMGHGIVQTAAQAGYEVIAVDDAAFLDKGMERIDGSLAKVYGRQVKKGQIDQV